LEKQTQLKNILTFLFFYFFKKEMYNVIDD